MTDIDLDFSRHERTGMPEIVYGQSKSAEQLRAIARSHAERHASLLPAHARGTLVKTRRVERKGHDGDLGPGVQAGVLELDCHGI